MLRQAGRLRRNLASEVNNADPQRSAHAKRRQWHRFQEVTAELTEVADAVIAAGLKLGGKPGRALNVAYENLEIALGEAYPTAACSPRARTAPSSTRSWRRASPPRSRRTTSAGSRCTGSSRSRT